MDGDRLSDGALHSIMEEIGEMTGYEYKIVNKPTNLGRTWPVVEAELNELGGIGWRVAFVDRQIIIMERVTGSTSQRQAFVDEFRSAINEGTIYDMMTSAVMEQME